MKQILFIINPKSGTKRNKELFHFAEKYLDKKLFSYKIVHTQYAGHATELARSAAENGVEIIAAMGGDGSVNEVAKGILDSNSVLAIVPKGSGNGLARALKISRDTRQAIEIINRQHIKKIDVAYANDHLFLSNAGVGFDAHIAHRFAKNNKRGLRNYTALAIKSFMQYKPCEYALTVDGIHYKEKALFIAIANGNQFGYEFKIAPQAQLDNALLDVCIMKPVRLQNILPVLRQSLRGKYNDKYVKYFRGKEIIVSAENLHWMQIDGDAINISETQKMEVHLHPAALQIIVP